MQPVETSPAPGHAETAVNESEPAPNDSRFVLLVGFLVGMSVAGIFLVYVVLSAAQLLK